MWVIDNGAPKAGSTWLIQLLEATEQFERIPPALQAEGWHNSSVGDAELAAAKRDLPAASTRFLSKQHWEDQNEDLLTIAGVKMVNIVRDVRDLVISRYHHNVRVAGETLALSQFIFKKGRRYVRDYCDYHRYWIQASAVSRANYHVASYEYLSYDLSAAASELYTFVGLSFSAEEAARRARRTVFSNQHQTGPGSFFRKGKALGFGEEIDDDESGFLLDCAREFGLDRIKQDLCGHSPQLAPYLHITDVGLGANSKNNRVPNRPKASLFSRWFRS